MRLGTGAKISGGARVGMSAVEWNPASIGSATLWADYDSRKNITLKSTLVDVTGGGPTITLTGTLLQTTVARDLRVEIINSTTCRISVNTGHDYLIVGGSTTITIPNGGTFAIPGTDWVLAFAAGVYATNHLYISQAETVGDSSGNGRHCVRHSSSSAPLLQLGAGRTNNGYSRLARGVMGRPALVTDAAAAMENAALGALFAGTSKAFEVWEILAFDALGAGAQISFSVADTTVTTRYIESYEAGATNYGATIRNASGTFTSGPGLVSNTKLHIRRTRYTGSALEQYIDNVLVASTACTGVLTANMFTLFAFQRTTLSGWAKVSWARTLVWGGALNVADAATADEKLRFIHDVYIPKNINAVWAGDSYLALSRGDSSIANLARYGNDIVTPLNVSIVGGQYADLAAATSTIDAAYNPSAAGNILTLHSLMNDLGADGHGDLPANEALYRAWIAARRAVGWYVVYDTVRPRNDTGGGDEDPTYAAKRVTANASIRSDFWGANAIVDTDRDHPGVLSDNIWFANDGAGHNTNPEASRQNDIWETAVYRPWRGSLGY